MSNRKASELNKYIQTLAYLGYTKDDKEVRLALNEVKKELGLLNITSTPNTYIKDPSKALVIVVADNSGSIGVWEKAILEEYLDLALNEVKEIYQDVEELYIGHTIKAKETNRNDLFKLESGGTMVSSGLQLLKDNLHTEREVIVIQLTDGDNLTSDTKVVIELLEGIILPNVKYFKYVEANQYNRFSTLVQAYKNIKVGNFNSLVIKQRDDALKGLR